MFWINFGFIYKPELMSWAPDLLIYPGYWSIVWLCFQVDFIFDDDWSGYQ